MKYILKVITFSLVIALVTGCYDRDIVDEKPFDYSLPKVENLNYEKQDNVISLTWQLPSDISTDFNRPLETSIQVIENNIYRQIIIVGNEDTSVDIAIDNTKNYRFIVKLLGYLIEEAKEEGKPDRVYSDGQVIDTE